MVTVSESALVRISPETLKKVTDAMNEIARIFREMFQEVLEAAAEAIRGLVAFLEEHGLLEEPKKAQPSYPGVTSTFERRGRDRPRR